MLTKKESKAQCLIGFDRFFKHLFQTRDFGWFINLQPVISFSSQFDESTTKSEKSYPDFFY